MIVNAVLGTVLWGVYAETHQTLEYHFDTSSTLNAAVSGGLAGGVQALLAAPAENVRLVLEGGHKGWSHAWKTVFRGTVPASFGTKAENMKDIRQLRNWMREVGEMAGRGWDGWGWGVAKDITGFAAFFAIFDLTRGIAFTTKAASQRYMEEHFPGDGKVRRHIPRAVHAVTLVSGGVIAGLAYEFMSRPWDVARKIVHLDKVTNSSRGQPAVLGVVRKLWEEGPLEIFRDPGTPQATPGPVVSARRRRLNITLRTLARVGPWGVGFLVWEAFGPGLL